MLYYNQNKITWLINYIISFKYNISLMIITSSESNTKFIAMPLVHIIYSMIKKIVFYCKDAYMIMVCTSGMNNESRFIARLW